VAALTPPSGARPEAVVAVSPGMTMATVERMMIEAALRETGGNRRKAAELLAIGERTMYRKLREYEADGTLTGVLSVDAAPDDESAS
jgi:DNA-binding NtrC family response regulator